MNPIDTLFQHLRARGRKAFLPFVTAGDPDLETTAQVINQLARRGASLIEVGFPYSDPLADGPVIQASYTRALDRGVRVDQIFDCVRRIARSPGFATPLVGMLAYSLVHRRGPAAFLNQAREAGLSGAIIPDLPIEEADELAQLAADLDFKLIHLVTPTTPRERAVRIARLSTGFLYYVSVTGITGERDRLPEHLVAEIAWLRGQTTLPICVGFGISKPEHVRLLREVADGVIVGSAIVRLLGGAVADIGALAQSLEQALNPE
jgi:tryptophan synthase alpha chain